MNRFRDQVLPYIGPLLAVIGSVGWVNSQIAALNATNNARDAFRDYAIANRDKEQKDIKDDIRELRLALTRCRETREHE